MYLFTATSFHLPNIKTIRRKSVLTVVCYRSQNSGRVSSTTEREAEGLTQPRMRAFPATPELAKGESSRGPDCLSPTGGEGHKAWGHWTEHDSIVPSASGLISPRQRGYLSGLPSSTGNPSRWVRCLTDYGGLFYRKEYEQRRFTSARPSPTTRLSQDTTGQCHHGQKVRSSWGLQEIHYKFK